MPFLNWCYGGYRPIENAELVDDQIFKAYKYKNRLIEIELQKRAVADQLARSLFPYYDQAKAAYDEAEANVEELRKQQRQDCQRARKRVPMPADRAEALRIAKEVRKEASAHLKRNKPWADLKRAQHPYMIQASQQTGIAEDTKDRRDRITLRDRYMELLEAAGMDAGQCESSRAIKKARSESGLHWGTYSYVEEAVSSIGEGRPPKFKHYRGDGSVAVPLSKESMTIEKATSGLHNSFRLELPELTERMAMKGKDHGLQARGLAWLRIQSGERRRPVWAKIPFVYSRPFPEGAVIKQAFIDRKRIAGKDHYRFRVVLSVPESRHRSPENGQFVTVHPGYRLVDGGVRSATIYDGTNFEEVTVPATEVSAFGVPSSLSSIRDTQVLTLRAELAAWLQQVAPQEEEWQRRIEHIATWKSPGRFQWLITWWRDNRFEADTSPAAAYFPNTYAWAVAKLAEYRRNPGYRPRRQPELTTVYGLLDFWRLFDKHLQQWADNQRVKVTARRNQMYRILAKRLRAAYSTVVLADINWQELRATIDADDDGDDVGAEVRRIADIASPGELTKYIREAFGDDVVLVTAENITAHCALCDKDAGWDKKKRVGTCAQCGNTTDLDQNAAIRTRTAGIERIGVITAEDRPRKKRMRRNRRRTDTTSAAASAE